MERDDDSGSPVRHGPLVAGKMPCLVGSEQRGLGALGLAAPRLQFAKRNRWIGWNVEQRQAYLHTGVNMSRFLIWRSVHCANLASRLLTMAVQRLPDDFEQRLNYRPGRTENFVDRAHYR